MSLTKPNIAIVAGRVSSLHRFDCFGHLGSDFQAKLLTLDHEKILAGYSGSLRQIIFEEKPDMAGYMPGLETHLQGQDLIICYESFQLSSFQASRIAQRHGIPIWIIADDPKPFRYVEYKNIRSIQSDVVHYASRFWVGAEASRNALLSEGINRDLARPLPLAVDCPPRSEVARLRKKFRNYVGVADNKIIVTIETHLDEGSFAFDLIKGLSLACEIRPVLREHMLLLIVGDGSKSRDLKCLAFDSNLKQNIMFMHQDVAKLSSDIFSASDFYIINPKPDDTQPYFAPSRALAAAAWGAIPIGPQEPIIQEIFDGHAWNLGDASFQTVAVKFMEIFDSSIVIREKSEKLAEHILMRHNAGLVASQFVLPELREFFQLRAEVESDSDINLTARACENLDADGRLEYYSEQLSLIPEQDFSQRSQIESSRAHILCERRLFDQAIEAYTAAVSLDPRNAAALIGLGNLSYQTQSYEEAMKFFKRALAIAPDDTAACAGLGMVYAKLGLHNDAIYWFEKSITHGNHRPGILTLMVQSCIESKSPTEALLVLERIEEIVGALETTQLAIARLHVKLGNGEQGREIMRKVLSRA